MKTPRILLGFLTLLLVGGCGERSLAPEGDQPNLTNAHQQDIGGSSGDLEDYEYIWGEIPGHLVAEMAPGWTDAQINATWGTTTLQTLPGTAFALLEIPPGASYAGMSQTLLNEGACLSCGRNFEVQSPEALQASISFYEGDLVSDDMADQSAFTRVGLEAAHARATGVGVTVAVIDTGIDFSHPELTASISPNGWDFVDGDADPTDCADGINQDNDLHVDEAAGHGTHVSGIVHAVAPDAMILPIRVLDTEGHGTTFGVAAGIWHAVQQGADIVNLSLGFEGYSRVIHWVVQQADVAGVFVVASAGNEGSETITHFPAYLSHVTAVAATEAVDLKADFSNYGSSVSMSAPGEAIISTYLFQGYAVWSGTSMAAPFISGAGALALEAGAVQNAHSIRADIEGSSFALPHQGQPYEGMMGAGRLDAAKLVASLLPPEVEPDNK